MDRRRILLLALGIVAVVAVVAAGYGLLAGGSTSGSSATGGPATVPPAAGGGGPLGECAALEDDEARECYQVALAAIVEEADDPVVAVEEIAAGAYADPGGFLLPNCHGIMHTVGREYAVAHDVTLATLMDVLPGSNDPGCSAGFAHGLVTGVAPQIDVSDPGASAAICGDTETRYQRYSCVHGFGHAFMRIASEDVPEALRLCSALGADTAPDCAQGAYHDYWFAVAGLDATERPGTVVEDPRELCGSQPDEFVRQCWYRAFLDSGSGEAVGAPEDVMRLCDGLDGLQREGCVTAASVIGPPDPRNQLSLCNRLEAPEDEIACIHGVKVQNLVGAPMDDFLGLIRQCDGYPADSRADCYTWLAKVIAVVTDGEFERIGCPAIPTPADRRACVLGSRSVDEPLVTFS